MPVESDRYEPMPSLPGLPAYLWRKLSAEQRRLVLVAGSLLLAALLVAAVAVVPQMRSERDEQATRAARKAAAAKASLRARYAREARPVWGRGPATKARHGSAVLPARRELVAGLQAAVLADAQDRARRGELHARYKSATCYGFPKRLDERPPAEQVGHATAIVECLAVSRTVARDERTTSGSLIGQPYRARIDFSRGRYAFCKIVQMPGELSIQREPVLKVPRACGGKS